MEEASWVLPCTITGSLETLYRLLSLSTIWQQIPLKGSGGLQSVTVFHTLNKKLVTASVIAASCRNVPFIVDCDASDWHRGIHFPRARWERESEHICRMCVGQPCAMLQHNKERDACQGICNQALLPLSVWETIHFQNRPQCAEVATELQITRGSSGQVAGVVSPVPQQDWTLTRKETPECRCPVQESPLGC